MIELVLQNRKQKGLNTAFILGLLGITSFIGLIVFLINRKPTVATAPKVFSKELNNNLGCLSIIAILVIQIFIFSLIFKEFAILFFPCLFFSIIVFILLFQYKTFYHIHLRACDRILYNVDESGSLPKFSSFEEKYNKQTKKYNQKEIIEVLDDLQKNGLIKYAVPTDSVSIQIKITDPMLSAVIEEAHKKAGDRPAKQTQHEKKIKFTCPNCAAENIVTILANNTQCKCEYCDSVVGLTQK